MAMAFFDGIFEVFNLYLRMRKEVLFSWALIYASWSYEAIGDTTTTTQSRPQTTCIIAVNSTTIYKDIISCASEDVNNIKWISL